jgi:phage terminase Nu1 subunit (DNA packaging protein)
MPNVATAAQAAKHLSLTASEFGALVKAGTITPAPNGKYLLDKIREQFCVYAQKTITASDAATAVQAAQHIHLGPSRFRDLVASGVFSHATRGNYSLSLVRQEYCANATKVMAGRGADGGASLSKQRARLATAQAETAERRNQAEAGLLVEVASVVGTIEPLLVVVRQGLLNLPGACADALTPFTAEDRGSISEILRKQVYQLLTHLSLPDTYPMPIDKKAGDKNQSDEPEKDIE